MPFCKFTPVIAFQCPLLSFGRDHGREKHSGATIGQLPDIGEIRPN
jgi:hypothetical protein